MEPDVILSAGNIAHYHHAALALQQAGRLKEYYCAFYGLAGGEKWPALLPAGWRKRLAGKGLPDLDRQLVRQVVLPYLSSQALRLAGLISQSRANLCFSESYDRLVSSRLGECRVFHWVQSLGLESAEKARGNGSVCVCDVRAAHIDEYETTVRMEYEDLGIPFASSRSALRGRQLAEIELANYLIISSAYAAETYTSRGFPSERIFILPYGADQRLFQGRGDSHPEKQIDPARPFRILFVGHVAPGKGVHYLLQAFMDLKIPDSELVLIGSVEKNYKTWLDSKFPARDNIKFIGHLPQTDLVDYYQNGDVFVLPSLSEGSAVVIYEAMSCGVPVIASSNAGSIIRDGLDGFMIPARNTEILQEKISFLYRNPDARRGMGRAALERVKEYTWDRYGERLLSIYAHILK